MSGALKRFTLIAGLTLAAAIALLVPAGRFTPPRRPVNVPDSAVLAPGGESGTCWIDCQNSGGDQFSCRIYLPRDGALLLWGSFQRAAVRIPGSVRFDGSSVHWKYGAVLHPVHVDCALGGKPPDIPDCRSARPQPGGL